MKKTTSLLTAALLMLSVTVSAQKLASPRDSVKGTIGNTTISINYGSPAVKERKIWGDLVPYGKVWRTGANEATTVEVSEDVLIGNKKLPRGRYAFFAIPTAKQWTLIFNKVPDQWGAYDYNAKKDALRVPAMPKKSASFNERLIYTIDKGGFALKWEKLEISVPVKTIDY